MREIDVLPSSPHSVAAALGLVEIPQNKLPGLGPDTVGSNHDVAKNLNHL